jgi:hypothetical protein
VGTVSTPQFKPKVRTIDRCSSIGLHDEGRSHEVAGEEGGGAYARANTEARRIMKGEAHALIFDSTV